jgi:hypothetical protein
LASFSAVGNRGDQYLFNVSRHVALPDRSKWSIDFARCCIKKSCCLSQWDQVSTASLSDPSMLVVSTGECDKVSVPPLDPRKPSRGRCDASTTHQSARNAVVLHCSLQCYIM